jgi:hypothetical protein
MEEGMAKYKVHYESIVQEKYIQEIEARSLKEAEKIAEEFCEQGDTSDFELDCVIGSPEHDDYPSIYSITKKGEPEVGRYSTEIVHHQKSPKEKSSESTGTVYETVTICETDVKEILAEHGYEPSKENADMVGYSRSVQKVWSENECSGWSDAIECGIEEMKDSLSKA